MARRVVIMRRVVMTRRVVTLVAAALVTGSLGVPRPAATQDLSAVGGALVGAAAGAWLSVAFITLQSRRGDYLDSEEEAFLMAAIPLFTGLTAGLALGVFAEDRLGTTLTWGTLGWASGIGVGALIGDLIWDDPQRRWAGGVIGGGVGLVAGSVAGLLSTYGGEDLQGPGGVPLMIRLRF